MVSFNLENSKDIWIKTRQAGSIGNIDHKRYATVGQTSGAVYSKEQNAILGTRRGEQEIAANYS